MIRFVTVKIDSQRRGSDRWIKCAHVCALLVSLALWSPELAFAIPKMTIDSVVVAPGQTANIALRLSSAAAAYGGFNASIYLPPGVSVVAVEPGAILPAGCVPYRHAFRVGNTQGLAITAFSATSTFSANGELCRMNIQVSATAAPGDYPMAFGPAAVPSTVNGIHALSSADGALSVAHTASDGILTIRFPNTPGDTNGNGIPDTWEILHFDCVTNVTALTDADDDGLPDYYEFLARTDPRDASSCLAIHAMDVDGSGCVLQWYSIPGARYTIERGDGLAGLWEFRGVRENILATPPLNIYKDTPASPLPSALFRILRQP